MENRYFQLAILACIVSICYWSYFSINALHTFHEYADLGSYSYDLFYHVHYPQIEHGPQQLVFSGHIAPDQLFLIFFYRLFPYSLTLLEIQLVILSLCGLLVFYITDQLIKDKRIALLLCIAFLLNPGLHGILAFDFHSEYLMIPFYLLTFYFFMKRKWIAFTASVILLLGAIDTAPYVAGGLAIGLLAYSIVGAKRDKHRKQMIYAALGALLMCIIALWLYIIITNNLLFAYSCGMYKGLPIWLRLYAGNEHVYGNLVSRLINLPMNIAHIYGAHPLYAIYGLAIVLFGFGVFALWDSIYLLFFTLPWLMEAFYFTNINFVLIWYQYFSYVIGGMVCGTILALINRKPNKVNTHLSIIAILTLLFLSAYFIQSANFNNLSQQFLFITPTARQIEIGQLRNVIAHIPPTATLMVPNFVMPQLANRPLIETIPDKLEVNGTAPTLGNIFRPEYILVDFNTNISQTAFDNYNLQEIINITGIAPTGKGCTITNQSLNTYTCPQSVVFTDSNYFTGRYYLYYSNGSAALFREV